MKRRSTRERLEAEMRLRHAEDRLRRLQSKLNRAGHLPEDSYRKAMLAGFRQKVYSDKRIARGEI